MAGVYFGIESGVVVVSMVERPATGGAWVFAGGVEQGGVRGRFRSMAIPRR